MLKQDRLLGDSVISTRDLGEELAKISLDLAKRENATYAELRLVNTRSEDVSVVNENPASEEASTIGVGIRVLYKDSGWGFADSDRNQARASPRYDQEDEGKRRCRQTSPDDVCNYREILRELRRIENLPSYL